MLVQCEYPNYHPLTALARLAHRDEVTRDPRLELEVHKAILPYVAPRLASVEATFGSPDDRRVVVTLFEDIELLDTGSAVGVQVPLLVEDARELVPLD